MRQFLHTATKLTLKDQKFRHEQQVALEMKAKADTLIRFESLKEHETCLLKHIEGKETSGACGEKEVLWELANLQIDLEKIDEAKETLRKGSSSFSDPDFFFLLGRMEARDEPRCGHAINAYVQANTFSKPNNPIALFRLVTLKRKLNETDDLVYRKALIVALTALKDKYRTPRSISKPGILRPEEGHSPLCCSLVDGILRPEEGHSPLCCSLVDGILRPEEGHSPLCCSLVDEGENDLQKFIKIKKFIDDIKRLCLHHVLFYVAEWLDEHGDKDYAMKVYKIAKNIGSADAAKYLAPAAQFN